MSLFGEIPDSSDDDALPPTAAMLNACDWDSSDDDAIPPTAAMLHKCDLANLLRKIQTEADLESKSYAIRLALIETRTRVLELPNYEGDCKFVGAIIKRVHESYDDQHPGVPLTGVSCGKVTTIGTSAFVGCAITEATFPKCTGIGRDAFGRCTNLTEISFPECTQIGRLAFMACTNLTEISFPECTQIGEEAFIGCSGLTEVDFPKCTDIGDKAFQASWIHITHLFLDRSTKLTKISFPECTKIGSYAFDGHSILAEATFPKCTQIGRAAFTDCTELTKISLPKCTQVGEYAFLGCENLANVVCKPNMIAQFGDSIRFDDPIRMGLDVGAWTATPLTLVDMYKVLAKSDKDRVNAFLLGVERYKKDRENEKRDNDHHSMAVEMGSVPPEMTERMLGMMLGDVMRYTRMPVINPDVCAEHPGSKGWA